jgi:nanoRNase/pAp phosphatase (c-di-AMP/oligoRNAs hydrolase)
MENIAPIVVWFDMDQSGAVMAWKFCFPDKPIPLFLKLIQDRDLWMLKDERTRPFSAALRTNEHSFAFFNDLKDDNTVLELVDAGELVLKGHEKNIKSFLKHAYEMDIGGYIVPAVNVPYHYASDTANELLKQYPEAPFAACWFMTEKNKRQFSLRSENSRIDVSEVASQFGGGGHRNAAGFNQIVD